MLIEPTETDRLETLDAFADALLEIAREEIETPELILESKVIPRVRACRGFEPELICYSRAHGRPKPS